MGDGLGGVNSSLAHRDMQRMQRLTVGKGGVNVLLATGCMLMLTVCEPHGIERHFGVESGPATHAFSARLF